MSFSAYFRLTSLRDHCGRGAGLLISGGVGVYLNRHLCDPDDRCLEAGRNTLASFSERVALGVILVSLPIFYLSDLARSYSISANSSISKQASIAPQKFRSWLI